MLTFICKKSILENLPKLVEVSGKPYILAKGITGMPILYSAICPHHHGTVEPVNEKIWRCPTHGWTFNPLSGRSINAPQSCLQSFPIKIENDSVYAELPKGGSLKLSEHKTRSKIAPKISLIAGACLLIEWQDFRILTDPWIEGPALFGSWTNYPPSGIKVSDLPRIDAIWISHEHSDHLHPYSLSLFDQDIPIFTSNLDNGRLVTRLKGLGFNDVREVSSFQQFSISKDVHAISFKSGSVWNDNILLLDLDGFTILNVNDAGFNWAIKDMVDNVDLVCSAFSQGASGYPLTWTHLDERTKERIMRETNQGLLKMLDQIVRVLKPQFLLPFASYNELYVPEHMKYEQFRVKNTPKTVMDYFKNHSIKVLDLIPGESWDGQKGIIKRRPNRKKFFNKNFMLNYLQKTYETEKNKGFTPQVFDITHQELKEYFTAFSNSPLAHQVGSLVLSFTAETSNRSLHALIRFENGKITYLPALQKNSDADITMSCPGGIIQEIICQDLSWDDAHAGYWCVFSRKSDDYNIAFWRLLHAPWQSRKNYPILKLEQSRINYDSSIASIVEKGGTAATQILERFGLYCAGCQASVGETIKDGCRLHGISEDQQEKLIEEIQTLMEKTKPLSL